MKQCLRHTTWIAMAIFIGPLTLTAGFAIADEDVSTRSQPTIQTKLNDTKDDALPPCCADDSDDSKADAAPASNPPTPTDPPVEELISTTNARASEWIPSEDRDHFDLDFKMTDQDGQGLTLSDLVGKPLAISFIFTRCPNPKMCPLITLTLAHLQRDLELAGIAQDVTLALLTYDPIYDTPERLHKYGQERGLQFNNAIMLRPDADEFRQLLGEFQVGVDYQADGSIGHFIELLIVDHEGRFVRDYQGDVWDNVAVLDDLKRLVSEQQLTHRRTNGSD